MNQYLNEIKETLLPLSQSTDIITAIEEWYFSGDINILDEAEETCELCGKEGIKYQHKIINRNNDNSMLVGSSCILRFGVAVYDSHGNLLDVIAAEKELRTRLTETRHKRAIAKLTELSTSPDIDPTTRKYIGFALGYCNKKQALTPKLARIAVNALIGVKLDYDPAMFKINLRGHYTADFVELCERDRKRLWYCLSSPQRTKIQQMIK